MDTETQRDERIDMANQITELMDVIKPFAEAAQGVDWEFTKDFYKFYPTNSYGVSITMGNLRKAMEVYNRARQ